MAIKELMTRIALKYDSYANWTDSSKEGLGANLVLLKGEIGICEIPAGNTEAANAPTVLFKVGNGTAKFHELKWASATAADVYSWAKAKTVAYDSTNKKISFKNEAGTEVHSIDLSSLATKAVTDDLVSRVAAIESSLGDSGSVAGQLAALDGRLDTIEGEGEGSIAKAAADALASAKAYADKAEEDAVAAAKVYTDAEVDKDRARLNVLEAADITLDNAIKENAAAIAKEASDRATAINTAKAGIKSDYEAADSALDAKIAANTSAITAINDGTNGVLATAKAYADSKVKALADGQVNTNKTDIATNKSDISGLRADLTAETNARVAADEAFDARLDKVETFFAKAEGETINEALDTLVEIQKYITEDGAAADEMVKDIAANASAIESLQDIVKDGGFLELRVDAAEADLSTAKANIVTLQAITSGYTGNEAIKTAVDAAMTKAGQGVADAKKAQDAADAAQGEIDALELVVGHATTGLAATKVIADDAQTRVAAVEPKVTQAEKDIDALEAVVKTGADSNANLRTAITNLQTLTGDASKGNEKLRTDLNALTETVNDSATGLAKTKAIADAATTAAANNATKIAAIEADYLKEADLMILNCGTAATVFHTK